MKKLLLSISLLLMLTACHHHEDEPEATVAQMTVLVYMAAENNLSSYAADDLSEMMAGSAQLTPDQNLIVYVDRANATGTPFLARVKDNSLTDTLYMDEGLAADPAVLANVIKTTKEHYPAQDYGLVLWGHASGWLINDNDSISRPMSRAYGGSTGNNSSSGSGRYWMNIPQMATAISSAIGNDKLRFILGDCCSFACIEIAYELRHVTELVIGSPAEIPDKGAPYQKIVPHMFSKAPGYYEQIIDEYFDYYIDEYKRNPSRYYNRTQGDLEGYSVPLSAIKTDELDQLASATATILNTISDKLTPSSPLDLEGTIYYAYSSYRYSYDAASVFRQNAQEPDFSVWSSALEKAVPYYVFSGKWMTNFQQMATDMLQFDDSGAGCRSVSMFFPGNYYAYTYPNWNKSIQLYQWNDVIRWQQYGW